MRDGVTLTPRSYVRCHMGARTTEDGTRAEYRIETCRNGHWTSDGLGDDVTFTSRKEARATLRAILNASDPRDGWIGSRFRIVEV